MVGVNSVRYSEIILLTRFLLVQQISIQMDSKFLYTNDVHMYIYIHVYIHMYIICI